MRKMEEEEEELKAISKAARSIAHDIRNPLSSIRTATYLLRNCSEDEKFKILKLIDRNILYADILVKNLLDFSAPQKYEFVEEDFNTLLRENLTQTIFPDDVNLTTRYEEIPRIKLIETNWAEPLQISL